jgi:hypothetical protein
MIKVLFFASNPEGTSSLRLDEEIRAITEKIRASEYRDVLELVSLWAVRPDDLLQALNVHRPQIVHFSGHGNAAGEIILMDNNRQPKPVSEAALRMLFTTLKDNIHVVVLNACYSQTQATAIAEVIDCVVGMSKAVGDDAAITFAASFYRAIGFGRSITEAFEQGKTAILLEGIPEADTPRLLTRSGIDPSAVFLVGGASTALPSDIAKDVPSRLKELLDSGSEFIDVPSDLPKEFSPKSTSDYIFCELRMRQTKAVFVFRVARLTRIGNAGEYLAKRLLPHLRFQDYEWLLVYNDKAVPSQHTFATAGIRSGDTVYLLGNHRFPEWMPRMRIG